MSTKEVERATVISAVVETRLKQREAMALLNLSKRQVIRLVKRYRRDGAQGLISKQRGVISNRRHDELTVAEVKRLVHQHYADFGPTLAAEKLKECHGLSINKETLRKYMMAWGLWKATRHTQAKVHQTRERRSCFGELIQLDGSHHDWFEGRRPPCCLLVLVDDATSRLVGLRFEEGETTAGYFHVVREYIEKEGRPLAFYSDKDSVFRINHTGVLVASQTEFERAMKELDIETICAHSPQAKGRVERANGTLQDRLVKEMRLRGIDNIADANAFLPTFLADYNDRFGKEAKNQTNAHRTELPDQKTLDWIFSFQSTRTLSKNLELSYKNTIYQLKIEGKGYRLQGAKVAVCESLKGEISLLYRGRLLDYVCRSKQRRTAEIMGAKIVNVKMDRIVERASKSLPAKDHPWRRYVLYPAKPATSPPQCRSNLKMSPLGNLEMSPWYLSLDRLLASSKREENKHAKRTNHDEHKGSRTRYRYKCSGRKTVKTTGGDGALEFVQKTSDPVGQTIPA